MDSGIQAQVAQNRLEKGTYGNQGEVLDFAYRDTQYLHTTVTSHRFFVSGVGTPFTYSAAGNKNEADVLLPSSNGSMPQGNRFTIKAIKAFFFAPSILTEAAMQNVIDLFRQTNFRFNVNNKADWIDISLAELFGTSFNAVMTPAVAGDNSALYYQTSIARAYPINYDLVLAAKTDYKGIVEHHTVMNAALNGARLALALQGKLERLS